MPVDTKTIFNSKIMINLTLGLPAVISASVIFAIIFPFSLMGYILLFIMPIVYVIFISVAGITLNASMPVFNWTNEATVIKQSAAVLISMLVGFASFMIPIALVTVLKNIPGELIIGVVTCLLIIITLVLYTRNNQISIKDIQ